jgi:hypothetical protein
MKTGLDINSPIGDLAKNPYAKAIVGEFILGFWDDPQVESNYGMTLPQFQQRSIKLLLTGPVTQQQINAIAAYLAVMNGTPLPNIPNKQRDEDNDD